MTGSTSLPSDVMSLEVFIDSLGPDMSKETKLYSRRWLNEEGYHGNGFIVTSVKSGGRRDDVWVDGDVTIADCTRSITLDFYVGNYNTTQGDIDNNLEKLDLIIGELTQFRRELKKQYKRLTIKDDDADE